MKFWSGLLKELKIAARGFYFYIELFLALLILGILLLFVPDQFNQRTKEFIFLDMPTQVQKMHLQKAELEDLDQQSETVILEIDGEEKSVPLYVTEEKEIYFLTSEADLEYMADKEQELAVLVRMDENYQFTYDYYLQGYESSKFKNLLQLINIESTENIMETYDSQKVRSLEQRGNTLTDKENILPMILVFNGALMGLFIIAAYIFLDKQEGVIQAYALTPSPVWQYLLTKIAVIMLSGIVSSLIVVVPLMKGQLNYFLLLLLLIASIFFSSSVGLVIASFYDNIIQAFGTIYAFIIFMLIPTIAYYLPSWNPSWVKWIPSYPMFQAFQSILSGDKQWSYLLGISSSFILIGGALFLFANARYKKDLVN